MRAAFIANTARKKAPDGSLRPCIRVSLSHSSWCGWACWRGAGVHGISETLRLRCRVAGLLARCVRENTQRARRPPTVHLCRVHMPLAIDEIASPSTRLTDTSRRCIRGDSSVSTRSAGGLRPPAPPAAPPSAALSSWCECAESGGAMSPESSWAAAGLCLPSRGRSRASVSHNIYISSRLSPRHTVLTAPARRPSCLRDRRVRVASRVELAQPHRS